MVSQPIAENQEFVPVSSQAQPTTTTNNNILIDQLRQTLRQLEHQHSEHVPPTHDTHAQPDDNTLIDTELRRRQLSPAYTFLTRPDKLNIDSELALKLTTVYDLHSEADLVDILHNYSVKEGISFIDLHFSLNAVDRLKSSMVQLVLFGKYLANTYAIDHVPLLKELRWRAVR